MAGIGGGPAIGAEGYPGGPLPFVGEDCYLYAIGNGIRQGHLIGDGEDGVANDFQVGQGNSVCAVAASTIQSVVAYAERRKTTHDPRVFVTRLGENGVIATLNCAEELGIVCLDIARDQPRLCILSDVPDHSIIVWDWVKDQILAKASARASRAVGVSWNPQNSNVLVSSGCKLELWQLASESGEEDLLIADPVVALEHDDREFTAHCWGAGDTVFAGTDSGELIHLNARTGKRVVGSDWLSVCDGAVTALALTLKYVVVGGSDGQVSWVLISGYTVEYNTPWVHGPVCTLSFSPIYDTLLIGTTAGSIYQCEIPRDLLTGGPEWTHESQVEPELVGGFHDGPYAHLQAFARIPVAVTVGEKGVLTVWKLPVLIPISSTVVSTTAALTCLALCEDARAMSSGTDTGHVIVYDLSDLSRPRCVFRERLHPERVCSVHLTTSLAVSAAEDGTIAFLSVSESRGVTALGRISVSPLTDMALIGGETVLASTKDGRMICCPVPSANALANRAAHAITPLEFTMSVPVLRFTVCSNDVIVCACADRGIRSYKLTTTPKLSLAPISELTALPTKCKAITPASPDGAWVLVGTADGAITVRKVENLQQEQHNKFTKRAVCEHSLGGVRGVASGSGSLAGWVFTAGGDGCLFAHAPGEGVPIPRENFPAIAGGLLSGAAGVEEDGGDAKDRVVFDEMEKGRGGRGLESLAKSASARTLLESVGNIRQKLAELLEENENRPEAERIDREKIVVDVGERDRLVALADERARAVRREIELDNMAKDLLASRIRAECHDSMDAKPLSVMPFGPGNGVANFPLPMLSAHDVARLERLKATRRIELRELKLQAKEGQISVSDGIVMSSQEYSQILKGAAPEEEVILEDEKKDENEELLYSHMELTKRERRVNQVELLRDKVRRVCAEFNKKVNEVIKAKGAEIDKVDERNVRLQEIMDELQVQEELTKLAPAPSEVEGKLLEVKDAEVSIPKYLSAAERLALEKQRLEEEEQKKKSAQDDQVSRALGDMMGGSLEQKKDSNVADVLEKPNFYGEENLTDEQQKAVKEYERRLQVLEEERDKQRRALETEAKKIRAEIQAILDVFDVKLAQLADDRLEVDAQVYQLQLQIALLLDSLVKEEDMAMHITRLQKQAETSMMDLESANSAVTDFKIELDDFREQYEVRLNEDKALDKALRREFADVPYFEELNKLWKRRRYPAADHTEVQQNTVNLDPFAKEAGNADEGLQRPEGLDWDRDFPEDIEEEVALKFEEMREEKINMELEIKRMANKLQMLNQRLAELNAIQADAQSQYEVSQGELKRLQEERAADEYDLIMLFRVKQGVVEIDMESIMDESSDGAMVEQSTINTLNDAVRGLGREKVALMEELKDFRSKIHAISWETECLDFKADEVADNTRFYQLLWVTKELQATIKGGDEGRKAAENATLEKQMQHSKKLHELKVEDMKKRLFKGHKQIREKELENAKLDEYVQDLAVSVAQREKIIRVRESDKNVVDENEYRMQEVVWRRLVLEEARQQAEDIAILKAEVDRLRQRTFPSFAKTYQQQQRPDVLM